MEDVNDADLRRERPNSHVPAQPSPVHRMQPAESTLHNYPPPPPPQNMQGPWAPPPSPYDGSEQRPHLGGEGPPPQPHYSASYSAPPPSRDQHSYPPEPTYSRQGSIPAPTRSPDDAPHAQYHPVNGSVHESQYYPAHGLPYDRSAMRYQHGPPEGAPNGAPYQPGLQITTGHEMMPGQPPGPPPGHYGQPPPHSAGPPQTPYSGPYYGLEQTPYGQRRKPVRAAQACDSCRQRKAKCDEGRPECEHCKANSLKCSYRDVQPPKQEKQVLQINEKLEAMHESIMKLLDRQDGVDSRLQSHGRQLELLQNLLPGDQRDHLQASKEENAAYGANTASVKQEQRPSRAVQSYSSASQTQAQEQQQRQELDERQEYRASHEFALPPKHFTAAQNLMQWPSVKALLPASITEKPTYVMDFETGRGLLRLYGCGEGEDEKDGANGPASPANSHSSSSGSRLDEEISTPSPNGLWGCGQLTARAPGTGLADRDHAGGVSPNGGLILDSHIVDRYFKSYMDNMHILHPFLEAKVLRDMVHLFKRRYSWDFVPAFQGRSVNPGKRKRDAEDSPVAFDTMSATLPGKTHRRNPGDVVEIEHSIANSIVLLVMALGKICAHRSPLPGHANMSTVSTSTPLNHFSDFPTSTSAPSSPYHIRGTKSSETSAAISSSADPRGKNMDVIPGLAYFALGADILGELPGGSSVSHVQANLLAGLYMGQLARIFPSHHYFSNAARGCMVLIESTSYKEQRLREQKRNLINFAFWSCLQLESDILAEVELPPSGITRYEGVQHAELPTQITLDPIPESSDMAVALRFYSYQIQLRRTLNETHKGLYENRGKDNFARPNRVMTDILNGNLEGWRNTLSNYDWEDKHHKSQDINVARMRGKYYGAKYIIHRPALAYALNIMAAATPQPRPSQSPMGAPRAGEQSSPAMGQATTENRYFRGGVEMGPPSKLPELDPWIKEACKTCVEAAIRSTTVFDAVPPRLIVTNIFGTAHAQFGNMLVLAATFKSELGYLVEEEELRRLLDRTINFLKGVSDISKTLGYDAKILGHIKESLFGPESMQMSFSAASSFGP